MTATTQTLSFSAQANAPRGALSEAAEAKKEPKEEKR
jgi:hypothetical protein